MVSKKEMEKEKLEIIKEHIFIYDRDPGEPIKAYRLFQIYCSFGRTRRYENLLDLSDGMKYQSIMDLASKYRWKLRAKAYDDEKMRVMMVQLDEEVMFSRIRQQRIGKDMQQLGEKGITMLNEYPEELSAADVSKLIDVGVKIERLALNSSTEITESNVDTKVSVVVEKIPGSISERIGKELAIIASKEMENED